MLQIKNVKKEYRDGDLVHRALNDVSLSFRDNEFVSILGPSGSGKTTLLNVVGGLDSYDCGDLIINNVSTKDYKNRDWDTYRNNTIGFVFQSYNLIPHQTVLGNVEIALTISGVSKGERKKRAKEALIKVGLKDHIKKRPNQLSGGQMQRVAIARALVNNPDILLADEPTGALDTETSIQIMELLKEVANDRLVIMVTHNSELAEEYSSRIVNLRDGKITGDSNPVTEEEIKEKVESKQEAKKKKVKKAKMSWFTSMSLSFKNLTTKKRRTFLTSFAGSIGIIGIAVILSMSTGVNTYIDNLQREMMVSYPISIASETMNFGQMFNFSVDKSKAKDNKEDKVYSNYKKLKVQSSFISKNNLTDFKKYLDDSKNDINKYLGKNGIVYSYSTNFSIYTYDKDKKLLNTNSDPSKLLDNSGDMMSMMVQNEKMSMSMMSSSSGSTGARNFLEMLSTSNDIVSPAITDNYNMIHGTWPKKYDEVVLFLDKNNSLQIDTLYQLGLVNDKEYIEISNAIENKEDPKELVWDYDKVLNQEFYMVTSSERYIKNQNGTFKYLDDDFYNTNQDELKKSTKLKIVGIAKPDKEASEQLMSMAAVGYTSKLTDHVIDSTNKSEVVVAQEKDKEKNVLTGMHFKAKSDKEKIQDAKKYISGLGISDKANLFSYIMYSSELQKGNDKKDASNTPEAKLDTIEPGMMMQDEASLAAAMDQWLNGEDNKEALVSIYDNSIGNSTYNGNMKDFGKVSYDTPSAISIYTDDFESKEAVANMIKEYNEGVAEENKIVYTDYVEMATGSMSAIINVISYVLIAFVSISLIVSCIMIGIITHISVMERTKEIGVLRALGASKLNISQVFNAETMIIGLCSGIIGILFTLIINIPITSVLQSVLDDKIIQVNLPIMSAIVLIIISVIITVIGGLIPAKAAAKKDPVVALRTE